MSNRPMYNTKIFTEVWEDYDSFIDDYTSLPSGMQVMKSVTSGGETTYPTLNTLYYLLYAKYGNNPLANMDEEQFKFKVFGIIFAKGPAWEKKLSIQEGLRALTEDDIIKGGRAIYNAAQNPSEEPTTSTTEELSYINSQNTTNYVKSKMEGYAQSMSLLEDDVTSRFINEFKVCFKVFVQPERTFLYEEDEQ